MGLKTHSAFSTGELDTRLQERVTLQKYALGLKTGRNISITKAGTVIDRPATKNIVQTKLSNREVLVYATKDTDNFIELGNLYCRLYAEDGTLLDDQVTVIAEADLPNIQFVPDGGNVFILNGGSPLIKITIDGVLLNIVTALNFYRTYTGVQTTTVVGVGTPTGYNVEYKSSVFKPTTLDALDGGESLPTNPSTSVPLPILAGESNTVTATRPGGEDDATEARIYRRPTAGGAFGLIGTTTKFTIGGGGEQIFTFDDVGGEADFSNQPIEPAVDFILGFPSHPEDLDPSTGVMYQQRFIHNSTLTDDFSLYASRTALINNFFRDIPLTPDSSLRFKPSVTSGGKILRLLIADGLIAFTKDGIFVHSGTLDTSNLSMIKRGGFVIKESLAPLIIADSIFFVDRFNIVRKLTFSDELRTYRSEDITIFSDQLFRNKVITSWGFQDGTLPLLWVVFDDGTGASLTYDREHEMRAWTRHDRHTVSYESVTETGSDYVLFVVKNGTDRFIERSISRESLASEIVTNREIDKGPSIAAMDSIVSFDTRFTLAGSDVFLIVPVTPTVFDGPLTLTCGTSALFPDPGAGEVGKIYRYFGPNGAAVDLTVTARASDNEVTVSPSATFPSTDLTGFNLFLPIGTFTGLAHLNGESVSVIVDGFIHSSPLNDIVDYPVSTPSGGSLTLADGRLGALVHIGRPIISDTETLDINTVEQSPTLIESKTIDILYIKIHESRTLFIGAEFPADDKVKGMEPLNKINYDHSSSQPIIGNRYLPPRTVREELTLPGNYDTQGRVAIRQVDPLHFEILSVIPDVEVLKRSDR